MMRWLTVGKINLYVNTKYYGTSSEITYVTGKEQKSIRLY